MADLLLKFLDLGLSIKDKLDKAQRNAKDCRRIGDLLHRLSAIAKHLPKAIVDDLMRDMAEGLRKALQRASNFVTKCEGKWLLSRAYSADDIAQELHGICLDVLLNMIAVLLANGALNNSVMAELKENMAQLLADVKYNKSMLAKILKIVAAQPNVHQRKEVEKLVKDYQISSQNKNKRETKITDVPSSQNKNKRETKITDVPSSQSKNKSEAKITDVPSSQSKNKREAKITDVPSSQSKNKREAKITDVPSSQNKDKREAKKTVVARPEVKNQKYNKRGGSTVVPHPPLPDGLAESAPAATVVRQCGGSSTIINKIISRSIENMTLVTSIDAHPTKPWIVTGHKGGVFSIWDYQKQETVMEFQVNKVPGKFTLQKHAVFQYVKETPLRHSVYSVKFIAEGKWLVVGDGHGYIHVYDYTDTKLHEVKKFRAHDKSVDSLAAHPTEPYLLSSSAFGRNIKVWDWSKNWEKIQNFYVEPNIAYYDGVHTVKFNPRDTDTFACVTFDDRVKVWNIKTSSLETTLKVPCVEADYFFTHQHLMVTVSNSHNSEILDLKTGKVVHTLSVSGCKTTRVACHPKLPILVTTLDDGTVCLWDASTYRLEKRVHITNSECLDLVFLPDTNGLPRLVVAFKTMIAIMEVNLPIANTSNASGLIPGINKERPPREARQRRPSRRSG